MKAIEFSPKLFKKLQTLRQKDKKFFQKVQKQLRLFQQDPNHKSLRAHKLKGNLKNSRSISIDMRIRMAYTEDDKTYYFFAIGTHDEVYK
ncbi:MAG TPA: type II toxin-antitoxin system mRNA interferase toxin, RelE/StbE family [Patescibacteria group bacterium]|nr:type II toxin-antitoxin system mRNA interferase toxin, RelE/StbE family [Patescibacteria group bacterium]